MAKIMKNFNKGNLTLVLFSTFLTLVLMELVVRAMDYWQLNTPSNQRNFK
jgi:hypothetical protein